MSSATLYPPEGNVKVNELNATQGSLLGFLHDGPKTGWDLLQQVEGILDRFWNITSSHVYRELRVLETRGLVKAGEPGSRERRPFAITAAGRKAFRDWIAQPPGPEQIRFPLLVTLWFARHLEPEVLAGFLESSRRDHEHRLALYRDVEGSLAPDDDRLPVIRFGLAYEQSIVDWLDETASRQASQRGG
jgi:DNA-binding PadR family transcriptional regulator